MVVVLPAPLGPMSPKISPSSTWKETSSTATVGPYSLRRCSTSTTHLRGSRGGTGADDSLTSCELEMSRSAYTGLLAEPDLRSRAITHGDVSPQFRRGAEDVRPQAWRHASDLALSPSRLAAFAPHRPLYPGQRAARTGAAAHDTRGDRPCDPAPRPMAPERTDPRNDRGAGARGSDRCVAELSRHRDGPGRDVRHPERHVRQ